MAVEENRSDALKAWCELEPKQTLFIPGDRSTAGALNSSGSVKQACVTYSFIASAHKRGALTENQHIKSQISGSRSEAPYHG